MLAKTILLFTNSSLHFLELSLDVVINSHTFDIQLTSSCRASLSKVGALGKSDSCGP